MLPAVSGLDRRSALAALGLAAGSTAVLAACSSSGSATTAPTTPSATSSGTTTLSGGADPRASAALVEQRLEQLSNRIAIRFPTTANVVGPIATGHAAHVAALVATAPVAATTPTTPPPPIGTTPGAALRLLAAAERAAARVHAAGTAGLDPSGARLLASIAAFASAQDVVLTRAAR